MTLATCSAAVVGRLALALSALRHQAPGLAGDMLHPRKPGWHGWQCGMRLLPSKGLPSAHARQPARGERFAAAAPSLLSS